MKMTVLITTMSILMLAAACSDNNNSPDRQITGIQPESGPPGMAVTITGTGFSPEVSENTVRFGTTMATVNSATESRISTQVPEGSKTGAVSVTVGNKTATGPGFTVEPKAPGISAINPDSGIVGTQVTITGMNFSATLSENTITFNGTPAPVVSANESELITEVPEGAADGPIEVVVNEEATTGPDFDVITTGAIEIITTTTGPDPDDFGDGYTVTIDGANNGTADTTGSMVIIGLEEGSRQIELGGVLETCAVEGEKSKSVNVTAGDTTFVSFAVACKEVLKNQIVFVKNNDLYLIDPDGTNLIRLTDNNTIETFPAISADGTKIAFYRTDNIWVINADGTDPVQLTNNTNINQTNHHPRWSPDGSQIVFQKRLSTNNDNGTQFDIFIINADGSGQTNLTNSPDARDILPEWTPDGQRIAFTSNQNGGGYQIYTMSAEGTALQQLTDNNSSTLYTRYSPDGSQIAFFSGEGNSDIYIMNADGTGLKQITDNEEVNDNFPSWSPDGSRFVFVRRFFDPSRFDIYMINTDGSGEINLTASNDSDHYPDWSPVE